MKIKELDIDTSYSRHYLEIKFALSNNMLQEVKADIDVLHEIIISTIYDIYSHVSAEIERFITHFLKSQRTEFTKTKEYTLKLSMDQKQSHAMLSIRRNMKVL